MSRLLPLSTAMLLSCLPASTRAAPVVLDSLHLLEQAGQLPDDFQHHFFDAPLILRVEMDGRYLGDARAVLSRDNAVSLLEFVEHAGSRLPEAERARWLDALAMPHRLGPCTRDCRAGMTRLHYSLESSLLSIASSAADAVDVSAPRHHALPQGGSRGLILHHQLNAYDSEGAAHAGRYALDAQASIGNWSVDGHYQVDRGSDVDSGPRHVVQSLYAQREFNDHFLRAGYFMPNFQGVTRQPRAASSRVFTTVGLMAGSSDSLRVDGQASSLYPVYVTANREGRVEVYRDGALIQSQPVRPGLQRLETQRLPGGIYEVELRVIEDGRETTRETAVIHKPTHWRDPSRRWRYSAFAGVQRSLLDSVEDPQAGELGAGGVINYLAHARAVLGVAVQQIGNARAAAGSLDWQLNDRASLYTNAYTSSADGHGVDLQGLMRYRNGSVMVSHNRSWQERRPLGAPWYAADERVDLRAGWLQTSAIGLNHRVGDSGHLAARVSHQRGISRGVGVDLSFSRRQPLWGSDASWRVSLFDRPGSASTGLRRNRGVDLSLNIALGRDQRRVSGSLGSRAGRQGGRDLYASLGVQQEFEQGLLQGVGVQATADRDGVGVSGNAQFEHPALRGDAYLQRSSLHGERSGGVNLESTLAVGGGRMALTGAGHLGGTRTGMIVDVRSDLPDVALRAHDRHGGSYVLRPGRNLLPVPAYRAGALQIDFEGRRAPAASIQPSLLPYHLNRGGVLHAEVEVLQTVTVLGQVRDAQGRPLTGARVVNHAGRSVAEADGFFALEVSRRAPTLEVQHPEVSQCQFALDGKITRSKGDVWMAGVLKCPPAGIAQRQAAPAGEAP